MILTAFFRKNYLTGKLLGLFLMGLAGFISCTAEEPPKAGHRKIPYQLTAPSEKFTLPAELREISGISMAGDDLMACIQDEKGSVYLYDLKKQSISKTIPFAKQGDYEDISYFEDKAYVLRSDGRLYLIRKLLHGPDKEDIEKFDTGLSHSNNTEGLFFDHERNRLLIACKGNPGVAGRETTIKAIYAYDLQTNKLQIPPEYIIELAELHQKIDQGKTKKHYEEFIGKFTGEAGQLSFQPSALAMHPFSKELYVISSVGKLLVIINSEGKIKEVIALNRKIFKQAEGITFDKDGNLYISNEGRGGKANILKFNYDPAE